LVLALYLETVKILSRPVTTFTIQCTAANMQVEESRVRKRQGWEGDEITAIRQRTTDRLHEAKLRAGVELLWERAREAGSPGGGERR